MKYCWHLKEGKYILYHYIHAAGRLTPSLGPPEAFEEVDQTGQTCEPNRARPSRWA
ncbi:hypothetical protein OHJ21_05150 [Virgibacillus sp. LDC1]|nr:hypothetical protein [Virgibacillus sp. LDC1]